MTTLAVTSVSSLLCHASTCFRMGSKFRCIRSTPTEMQSMSENDFECFASTGVNALGTMFPDSTAKKFAAAASLVNWLSTGSTGGGIGSGSGGGVGSGRGRRRSRMGRGNRGNRGWSVSCGRRSHSPSTYGPELEFSEETRKAELQGTLVLWRVVGPDGMTHDIRVQQSLGMGLDEKAIEAIRQWKFDPGRKDGIPVAVQVDVEVNFHLY